MALSWHGLTMALPGKAVRVVRTVVAACVWVISAGLTITALVVAHLVGRGEQLESRMLALVRPS
jgi:hypothetical protein